MEGFFKVLLIARSALMSLYLYFVTAACYLWGIIKGNHWVSILMNFQMIIIIAGYAREAFPVSLKQLVSPSPLE